MRRRGSFRFARVSVADLGAERGGPVASLARATRTILRESRVDPCYTHHQAALRDMGGC